MSSCKSGCASCRQQGHVGSQTLLQQNRPVLNWGCPLTQVVLYTTTMVSQCRKRTSGFMVQRKINRGRHTDHPAGRHSIRTNQCPPPPSPIFFTGRMPFLPSNQQRQSTEGNQCIRIREMLEFSSTVLPAPSPYLDRLSCIMASKQLLMLFENCGGRDTENSAFKQFLIQRSVL